MIDNTIKRQRVLLIGVDFYNDGNFNYYMEELKNLCLACDFEVIDCLTQNLTSVNRRHYFRSGKLLELKAKIDELAIDLVIANNELTGSQNKNMFEVIECKIIDRTQLVLEIFARRAKTSEAKMQVELALLKYKKPRMGSDVESADRQKGGGGIQRGAGETKLEIDVRKINTKMAKIKEDLAKIVVSRDVQRATRNSQQLPIVAVVGYTNVGKSTLMNALVDEDKAVFERDLLFATLDTAVRKVKLNSKQSFLLIDTVGFVSNLSHDLISAFRSTLEEILTADLIIHLQDITNSNLAIHHDVVTKTLKVLNASAIPTIEVLNFGDRACPVDQTRLTISAKHALNLDLLKIAIGEQLFKNNIAVKMVIPYSEMSLIKQLVASHEVTAELYDTADVKLTIKLADSEIKQYQKYIV